MKMLYTANGRYIRCCTEEGTRPVIIVCEKEYEVDVQEFMLRRKADEQSQRHHPPQLAGLRAALAGSRAYCCRHR